MNLEAYARKISPVFWQDLLQDAYLSAEPDKKKVIRTKVWDYGEREPRIKFINKQIRKLKNGTIK